MTLERFPEEALGGSQVTAPAEPELDRVAIAADGTTRKSTARRP